MECQAKTAQQFFFATNNGRIELRRRRLTKLFKVFGSEAEINSTIAYRVARIVDSLIEVSHAEVLQAFMEFKIDELLLHHFYDDSIASMIYFNALINIKGSAGEFSVANDFSWKSRSPSIEVHNCCDKSDCEHQHSESFTITVQECRNSPTKRSLKEIGLSYSFEEESKDSKEFKESKRVGNGSLNVSNNLDPEKEKDKIFSGAWEYRQAVIRKLLEMISATENDDSASNGLALMAKFVKEIQSILGFKQILVALFYKENYLLKIYSRAKITTSDTTFARAVDVLIAFLELHKDLFSSKQCEDRGIKLGTKFCGTFVDIIEELKESLNLVK